MLSVLLCSKRTTLSLPLSSRYFSMGRVFCLNRPKRTFTADSLKEVKGEFYDFKIYHSVSLYLVIYPLSTLLLVPRVPPLQIVSTMLLCAIDEHS